MATFPAFNFEVQVIAAFMVFVFGYVALFSSLMIFLFLAKGLYESAKAVRAYAVRYGSTNTSNLLDIEIQADRQKRFVIPSWKRRLAEATNSSGKD